MMHIYVRTYVIVELLISMRLGVCD